MATSTDKDAAAAPAASANDASASAAAAPAVGAAAPEAETKAEDLSAARDAQAGGRDAAPASSEAEAAPAWSNRLMQWRAHLPLAASLVAAVMLGAAAGAATTAALRDPPPPPQDGRELRDAMAKLGGEVAALKSGLTASSRSTSAQLGKFSERFDRLEKSQAETAAKFAKAAEGLERRAAAKDDVTGSVPQTRKDQDKPSEIEGWRLREFYAGRALLESRSGTLYEVGPGQNIPGLGRVASIKRENGRVVVTTPKGTISSTFESLPRRPPAYIPYRYY